MATYGVPSGTRTCRLIAVALGIAALAILWSASFSVQEARAGKKKATNAEKIIGIWEAVKGDLPPGATIEFTKAGQAIATIPVEKGKSLTMKATYKVEGNKLTVKHKIGEKEQSETDTIKTLTEKKLVIEDKKGKTVELKRKK